MRVTLNTQWTDGGIVCTFSDRCQPEILRNAAFGIIKYIPDDQTYAAVPQHEIPRTLRRHPGQRFADMINSERTKRRATPC